MTQMGKNPEPQMDGLPAEEDLSPADVEERMDEDPDEQSNFPDQPGHEDAAQGLRED